MLLTSILWLCLLVVVAILYGITLARRSDYDCLESCLYLPTYLVGRLLWRVHFRNKPPEEIQGGAILVANHRSSVDPLFVQLAARRRVHWMVAKEYCQHFLFGPILKVLQVIPTNRSGMDTASVKTAVRMTRAGKLVGMFPEGRLNKTDRVLLDIRSGAALVASKASVPIIPLYIAGSPYRREVWSPFIMPARVSISFGNTLYPNIGPSVGSSAEETDANDHARQASDELILRWAEQVLQLAGRPCEPIRLTKRRKRRKRS